MSCVCLYTCTYVCLYIYRHTHIHIHTHVYTCGFADSKSDIEEGGSTDWNKLKCGSISKPHTQRIKQTHKNSREVVRPFDSLSTRFPKELEVVAAKWPGNVPPHSPSTTNLNWSQAPGARGAGAAFPTSSPMGSLSVLLWATAVANLSFLHFPSSLSSIQHPASQSPLPWALSKAEIHAATEP